LDDYKKIKKAFLELTKIVLEDNLEKSNFESKIKEFLEGEDKECVINIKITLHPNDIILMRVLADMPITPDIIKRVKELRKSKGVGLVY